MKNNYDSLDQLIASFNSGSVASVFQKKFSNPLDKKSFSSSRNKTLDNKKRYLQIAFNHDYSTVYKVLPQIPKDPRIIIEAGTPYLKRNGSQGIRVIRGMWPGLIVADLKILDGALGEIEDAHSAGADCVTIAGSGLVETIRLAVDECRKLGIVSMVDMLNVPDPLRILMKARANPDVVVLHRGRDEENSAGKIIEYRHVKRIKSKFSSLISAAGGVGLKEAQSASFNGANIVVVNLAHPSDPWSGIRTDEDIALMAKKFLETID